MDEGKVIKQLFCVVEELDARECSLNSIAPEYHNISWKELCDIGIELFKQIRE